MLCAVAVCAARPVVAGAQSGPSAGDTAAQRAVRVAKDIVAPGVSDSGRAAARRAADRILDSAEAAGGPTALTHFARTAVLGYVVDQALGAARAGGTTRARCVAARRAKATADTLQGLLPAGDESPSPAYQATLRRWWLLSDTAGALVRASCPRA